MENLQIMKDCISCIVEYMKCSTESAASKLQQVFEEVVCTLTELNAFDPMTYIAAEFYVSLYELIKSLGPGNNIVWSAIKVLEHASKNSAAKYALIHTFKFAPILAKLLESNLVTEKKIHVLRLLQDLTYGIKICWHEVHLPHLIINLTQWVSECKEEEIVALSLGVLVNITFKNLPATYALMRTIDTKLFIRSLAKIESCNIRTRVQSCKLLIILEQSNKNVSEKLILDFISITFSSLIAALKEKDVTLLKHIVDFFDYVEKNEYSRGALISYTNENVQCILNTLKEDSDPNCVTLIMEFLLSVVKLKLPTLIEKYPSFIKAALIWISKEEVSSTALALIRAVIIDLRDAKSCPEIFAELDPTIFITLINIAENRKKNGNKSVDSQDILAKIMQLFHEMIKTPILKAKVLEAFNEKLMRKLLSPILNVENFAEDNWPGHLIQNPKTNLCIYALALIADLATNNSNWLALYNELLRNKQIQMIMAFALFTGDVDIKQTTLQLTTSIGFQQDWNRAVANCMHQLEPLMLLQSATGSLPKTEYKISTKHLIDEMPPLFSFAQEGRLDAFIERLQNLYEANKITDVTTSQIMELYEYKLLSMRNAEKALESSIEAANSHSTKLQHRLAQVIAESNKLHRLLFDKQQCFEGIQAEKEALIAKLSKHKEESKKTNSIHVQEINGLKKIVIEKTEKLENTIQMNEELNKRIKELEYECLQEKVNVTEVTQKNQHLQQLVQNYEQTIAEKEADIKRIVGELNELSRMRDMIFQLTAKAKDDTTNT